MSETMNTFDHRDTALIRSTRLIKLSQIAASALLSSLLAVAAVPSAFADQHDCTSGTGAGALQCLSPKLAEARKQLQESYDRVLQKAPKTSAFDERKTAQQLEKAQSAWEAYAKENCAYVGGLRGGSNAWVSVFVTLCLIKEIDSRTDFLNHPTSGG
jgi:uncharacterized protein YecT (DUF1311 family)